MYCYECHEELLRNPVLLPNGVSAFSALVRARGLNEDDKPEDRSKVAGRIMLFPAGDFGGAEDIAGDG